MARSRQRWLQPMVLMIPSVLACAANGGGDAFSVVGLEDAAYDAQAVQDAVDAFPKVTLVGTFDFGPTGRVVITHDVAISGENATVKGGSEPFSSPLPEAPIERPGPAISIRNVTFDGAERAAISLAYARSADVSQNRIRNVRPLPSAIPNTPVTGLQGGIVLGPPSVSPGAFTGSVLVRDNDIDMSGADPAGTMCQGVAVMRASGATAVVAGNAVAGCSRNAIEAIENYRDAAGAGSVEISDNRLDLPAEGVAYPTASRPNGIIAGWFLAGSNAVSEAANPSYRVSGNSVTGGGRSTIGIFANSKGVTVEGNHVAIGGAEASGIMITSPGGHVTGNEVQGSGRAAFFLLDYSKSFPGVTPDGNTVQCNDASSFAAGIADLVIQGTDNTVLGTGRYHQIVRGTGNAFPEGTDCP